MVQNCKSPGAAWVILSSVGIFLILPEMHARAQDDRAAARVLFQQGIELADHEQWPEARDRFTRALALYGAPSIELNLAMACEHTGALVEAVDHFESVRRNHASTPDFVATAQRELAALRPRLGRLTVSVTGAREGAAFRLDGRPLAEALVGVEVPADPGHHVVVAMRGGAEVARAETDVAEGGAGAVSLDVPAPIVVPPPDEVAHHDERRDGAPVTHEPSIVESPWLWIGVGAAVAIAVVVVLAVVLSQPQAMLPEGSTSPGTIHL